MLTLALVSLLAQTPQHRLFKQPNLPRSSYAFFEAFSISGAGTTGVCSTTAPTGARGEALTFSRGSTAYCTKTASGGLSTTGIADGDLVSVGNNVARQEYDSNGVLGLRVEGARTNSSIRSEELDAAAWGNSFTGTTAPVLNGANAVIAPNGTQTAEDYSFPGWTSAAAYSYRSIAGCLAGSSAVSIYAKSISGGTTLDIVLQTGATTWANQTCTISTDSWTRCTITGTAGGSNNWYIGLGQVASGGGGVTTTRTAARVALWGGVCEAGAYVTSYIATTTAAVQRVAESAFTTITAIGPTASFASSVVWPSANVGAVNFATIVGTGSNNFTLYRTSNTAAGFQINATTTAPAVSAMGTTQHRAALADNAGVRSAFWDGASVAAPAATMAVAATTAWLGSGASGVIPCDGIVSGICADPDPTRCR